MGNVQPHQIKTIREYHSFMGLPKPEHPLISVINLAALSLPPAETSFSLAFDFFPIALKRDFNVKMKYGQQEYDFDEGVMFFISPNQVFGIEIGKKSLLKRSGWMVLIHPDFLWNTPLANIKKQYEFFDYAVHEALFLSPKEETTIIGILQNIEQEYCSNIDKFSQDVIIAQLELLLTYSDRFYHRQFITTVKACYEGSPQDERIIPQLF